MSGVAIDGRGRGDSSCEVGAAHILATAEVPLAGWSTREASATIVSAATAAVAAAADSTSSVTAVAALAASATATGASASGDGAS